MHDKPKLIVMLTHNDMTVKNAYEIFEKNKNSSIEYWGIKEEPLDKQDAHELISYMKKCGKKTILEVVAYDEEKSVKGAEMAARFGCDFLMGTMFFDSVNDICKKNGIKYLPFVGKVSDRPSILNGTVDEIITEAKMCISRGAYGIDLLGYRYVGNPVELITRLVNEVNSPVCVAGSINSYDRLDDIKRIKPWSFTIGSAFFEKNFGDDISEQIYNVFKYIEKE